MKSSLRSTRPPHQHLLVRISPGLPHVVFHQFSFQRIPPQMELDPGLSPQEQMEISVSPQTRRQSSPEDLAIITFYDGLLMAASVELHQMRLKLNSILSRLQQMQVKTRSA